MKRNRLYILVSLAVLLVMVAILQWQGKELVSPVSPNGILDVEFARTGEQLQKLLLFLGRKPVEQNLFLDFPFIAAYGCFLYFSCIYIREKTGWNNISQLFASAVLVAAFCDIAENFILLLVLWNRFNETGLAIVYYLAIIKFLLAGSVVLFLLFSWPFALRRRPGK